MVVSCRRFGTTYRFSFQGSSSPRRNTRNVSVLFPATEIMNIKKKHSKRTFPSFLPNSSKLLRTGTYPSSTRRTQLPWPRLVWAGNKGLFDSLNVCLCSCRTFKKRVFTHLLKQNSTRTGLSGIYVLRTSGSVYGTLFPPKLHHAYHYYL